MVFGPEIKISGLIKCRIVCKKKCFRQLLPAFQTRMVRDAVPYKTMVTSSRQNVGTVVIDRKQIGVYYPNCGGWKMVPCPCGNWIRLLGMASTMITWVKNFTWPGAWK